LGLQFENRGLGLAAGGGADMPSRVTDATLFAAGALFTQDYLVEGITQALAAVAGGASHH